MEYGMKNFKNTKLAVAIAAAMGFSLPVGAIVVVGGDNGWEVSFDGNINQFYVWSDPSGRPDNVIGGNMNMSPIAEHQSRFRSGLMPSLFGFNVKAPTWNGLDIGGRISFAGEVNNSNTQNRGYNGGPGMPSQGLVNSSETTGFGGNLEFREAYFTIDGQFGQILMGRTLDVFMGKNILTDQTLFGVGATGDVHGGGFTLGRIGYGYLYPNFNAQLRWTSPDMAGVKLTAAAVDPSQVCGAAGSLVNGYVAASGANCYNTDSTPRAEGMISYARSWKDGSWEVWGSGVWQNFTRNSINQGQIIADGFTPGIENNVWGWSTGSQLRYKNWDFNGSYYSGRGLGSSFLFDADSMDASGHLRRSKGWMAQWGYTFLGHTKLAFSYGTSRQAETGTDQLMSSMGYGAVLKDQQSYTAGIYHDVNSNLKLVAEWTREINEWYGHGNRQTANVVGVGGYFFW